MTYSKMGVKHAVVAALWCASWILPSMSAQAGDGGGCAICQSPWAGYKSQNKGPDCGCDPSCGVDASCGCEPKCGAEPGCGCDPACGCEPACGTEPACGCESGCTCEAACGCEPACGSEPACGCETGCDGGCDSGCGRPKVGVLDILGKMLKIKHRAPKGCDSGCDATPCDACSLTSMSHVHAAPMVQPHVQHAVPMEMAEPQTMVTQPRTVPQPKTNTAAPIRRPLESAKPKVPVPPQMRQPTPAENEDPFKDDASMMPKSKSRPMASNPAMLRSTEMRQPLRDPSPVQRTGY